MKDGPFNWDKKAQGLILSIYFYGYILTQVPGGYLSSKYGGVKVVFVSNLLASIFTLLTPVFSRWGFIPACLCRFLCGLSHGAFWPSMSSVFVSWAPARERTKMLGSSVAGRSVFIITLSKLK